MAGVTALVLAFAPTASGQSADMAAGHSGRHGDGHAEMHDIYKLWSPPLNPNTSCCDNSDYRPTRAFGGTYHELVPNERLRYTATFDDPKLPGELTTTIALKKVSVSTEIDIVQKGIPAVIPTDACYLGWQESLALLTQLAQPEIPG